jgi:hypothetical protein
VSVGNPRLFPHFAGFRWGTPALWIVETRRRPAPGRGTAHRGRCVADVERNVDGAVAPDLGGAQRAGAKPTGDAGERILETLLRGLYRGAGKTSRQASRNLAAAFLL